MVDVPRDSAFWINGGVLELIYSTPYSLWSIAWNLIFVFYLWLSFLVRGKFSTILEKTEPANFNTMDTYPKWSSDDVLPHGDGTDSPDMALQAYCTVCGSSFPSHGF